MKAFHGTRRPEDCTFPFTYNKKEYNSCTTEEDPDKKHWCAVEVDADGNSEGKRWGHCDLEVSRTLAHNTDGHNEKNCEFHSFEFCNESEFCIDTAMAVFLLDFSMDIFTPLRVLQKRLYFIGENTVSGKRQKEPTWTPVILVTCKDNCCL